MSVDPQKLRESVVFFRDIDAELIDGLIPYMRQRNLNKGELIFLEGDQGNEIYFIISGSVSIYTFDKSKKVILALLREGDYFGEMALMKPGLLRSATAECLSATRLYSLGRKDFQLLIAKDHNIAFNLLDYTMERLRRANRQIYDLTFLSVRSRLIKTLISMAAPSATDSRAAVIPVKVTHQHIAEMIGAVRETVSKLLQELQDEGLIKVRDKRIHLPDLLQLQAQLSDDN